jgi:hypothetical protein
MEMTPMNDKATIPELSEKSERIVVDEIFDDGTARLLRATRLTNKAQEKDLAIHTWGEEREDFIEAWRVSAANLKIAQFGFQQKGGSNANRWTSHAYLYRGAFCRIQSQSGVNYCI